MDINNDGYLDISVSKSLYEENSSLRKNRFYINNGDLTFTERPPDINSAFNLIYRNDSLGMESDNTGFFLFFKQGTLTFQDDPSTCPSSFS